MDNRENEKLKEQAQKTYQDKTCGMRPMTYVEVLEQKRDRMIDDLHAIGELISIAKNGNLSDYAMNLIQRFL